MTTETSENSRLKNVNLKANEDGTFTISGLPEGGRAILGGIIVTDPEKGEMVAAGFGDGTRVPAEMVPEISTGWHQILDSFLAKKVATGLSSLLGGLAGVGVLDLNALFEKFMADDNNHKGHGCDQDPDKKAEERLKEAMGFDGTEGKASEDNAGAQ